MCIDVRLFFACGSSAPGRVEHQDGTAACDTGTKAALSVQGHGLLNLQELWPHQSFFEHLVAGDQKASLAKSFSVALPIQALRGLPCLGSFSVGHIRHIEGPPLPPGVLLCSSVRQARLMGQPRYCSDARCWCVGKERLW